jgi:hypothetical protein
MKNITLLRGYLAARICASTSVEQLGKDGNPIGSPFFVNVVEKKR